MVSLSSAAAMLEAVRTARSITCASYFLRQGPLREALVTAAKRGARVRVRLDGALYGGSRARAADNNSAVNALRAAKADVRFVHCSDHDRPGLHMKALVCDGTAFLDDCNWARGGDTIVRDDTPPDVRAVLRAALYRHAAPVGPLAFTKAEALQAEAHIAASGTRRREVDVETETLGASAVSKTLRTLAAGGVRCRVLVSEHAFTAYSATHDAAVSLAKAGVEVRTVKASEKVAVAGSHAWIGSANATSPYCDRNAVEWSLSTGDARIVRGVRRRFEARWCGATPVRA